MSYSDKQWDFLRNVGSLISYIGMIGWKATGGDLLRSYAEQQRKYDAGLSKAKPGTGRHEKKMAIDLNFWDESGDYVPGLNLTQEDLIKKMKPIADYWEGLSENNCAGLYFESIFDPYHFERMD